MRCTTSHVLQRIAPRRASDRKGVSVWRPYVSARTTLHLRQATTALQSWPRFVNAGTCVGFGEDDTAATPPCHDARKWLLACHDRYAVVASFRQSWNIPTLAVEKMTRRPRRHVMTLGMSARHAAAHGAAQAYHCAVANCARYAAIPSTSAVSKLLKIITVMSLSVKLPKNVRVPLAIPS